MSTVALVTGAGRGMGAACARRLAPTVDALVLANPLVTSYRFKRWLLRLFGARVGRHVIIKPGVRVKYPWRLTIGDNSWIGERAWIGREVRMEPLRNVMDDTPALVRWVKSTGFLWRDGLIVKTTKAEARADKVSFEYVDSWGTYAPVGYNRPWPQPTITSYDD